MKSSRFSLVCAVSLSVIAAVGLSGCAGAVIGAGATVGSAAVDERGVVGSATDVRIRSEINTGWAKIDTFGFTNVGLLIRGGRVVLTGTVDSADRYRQAVDVVKGIKGVTDIYVHVRVAESGVVAFASDASTVAEMRKKIFFDKSIVSLNYDLDVSDSTLYILGIAQDEGEHQRVLAQARTISGLRQIVDYIITKDQYQKSLHTGGGQAAPQASQPTEASPAEPAVPDAPMPLQPASPPVRSAPVEVQPL
jgi:osmotically-inducible protein OsmY